MVERAGRASTNRASDPAALGIPEGVNERKVRSMDLELELDPVRTDLSAAWRTALVAGFQAGEDEPALVKRLTAATTTAGKSIKGSIVTVEAAFVHGGRSMVRFDMPTKGTSTTEERELGDLMLLANLVAGGRLVCQRVAIVQVKKHGGKQRTGTRYGIQRSQLFLLQHFPVFDGVSGMFSGRSGVKLPNRTGHLGMYMFLSSPAEIALLLPSGVDHLLGGRDSLMAKELAPLLFRQETLLRGWLDGWPLRLDEDWIGDLYRSALSIDAAGNVEALILWWLAGLVGQSWVPEGSTTDRALGGIIKSVVLSPTLAKELPQTAGLLDRLGDDDLAPPGDVGVTDGDDGGADGEGFGVVSAVINIGG